MEWENGGRGEGVIRKEGEMGRNGEREIQIIL